MKIWQAIITRGPIVWFRNLFYIVSNYRDDLTMLANGVDDCCKQVAIAERYIKKATKLHVNIAARPKDRTTVVVIGTYRGKDHVQVFGLRAESIDMVVNQLKELRRYAEGGCIDVPPNVDATVRRELIR